MKERDFDTLEETPLGTILPMWAEEEIPRGWYELNGQAIPGGELIEPIEVALRVPLLLKWWTDNGGSETHLPNVGSDDVWRSSMKIEPPEGVSKKLKLVIKLEKS